MISAITTSALSQSFALRTGMPKATLKNNAPARYFENLDEKIAPVKLINVENSFEFSFDDMF